jgi:DNA repair exonuclease SbcCD ATPase subunit
MVAEPERHAAERTRRIGLSVDREVARRQRLIRIYLALVAVPLAVAGLFLAFGRTDRQVVQQEVDKRVTPVEESYREIQPMLSEVRGVGELLPQIQAVGDRFQSYEQGQDSLRRQVAQVTAQVGELQPAVEEGRQAKAEIAELRRDYESQQQELKGDIEALARRFAPALGQLPGGQPPAAGRPPQSTVDRLAGRTAQIEQQQAELSRQMALLQQTAPQSRPPADLDALNQRLKALERSVETLQREIRAMQAEIKRLGGPG